jgi:hypothetical protein
LISDFVDSTKCLSCFVGGGKVPGHKWGILNWPSGEAVEYYDFATEGLGNRLLNEVISAVEHLEKFPEIATVVEYNVRRKVLARFPYRSSIRRNFKSWESGSSSGKKNSWLNPLWRADVNPVTGYPFHNFGTSMRIFPREIGKRADCHRSGWSFAYLSIRVFFPTLLNVTVSFTSSPTRSRFSMIPSPN